MSDGATAVRTGFFGRFFARYGRLIVIGVPMIWLLIFFLAPFLVVFKLSFSEATIARPPYLPLMTWEDGRLLITLNFENYRYLVDDGLYVVALLTSLRIAAVSTLLALLIGYPMALYIARCGPRKRTILLMLVILPFWTSFLLRVYAWIGILRSTGIVNNTLLALGIIDEPLIMLQTDFAVYLGIVYTYLPLMILPLYANLTRHDGTLLEAASDLGANPLITFLTVTLPLSLPGIVAGCMLVFIPAIGEFIIPELLGGPDTLMIGKVLWGEFFSNRDWPVASAVAIVLLVIVVLPVMRLRRAREAGG